MEVLSPLISIVCHFHLRKNFSIPFGSADRFDLLLVLKFDVAGLDTDGPSAVKSWAK